MTALSEEERRVAGSDPIQCAEDQREALKLIVQIPMLVEAVKTIPSLQKKVDELSVRMDNFDSLEKAVVELKSDLDQFKDTLGEDVEGIKAFNKNINDTVIKPLSKAKEKYAKFKSRIPLYIIFYLAISANWGNAEYITKFFKALFKLVGV